MHPLHPAHLLDAWEHGLTATAGDRAVAVLAAIDPAWSPEALRDLPVGQCDARLLACRERAFGTNLAAVVACSGCGETIEIEFDADAIRVPGPSEPLEDRGELRIEADGYAVRFRVPTGVDLRAVAACPGAAEARAALFARCVLAATRDEVEVPVQALPASIVGAVEARMAAADPQADVRLACSCPACDAEWLAAFDIADFLWTELNAWARRTLRDVHRLASGYGWREADVLALGSMRRQAYLALLSDDL